MYWIKSFIILFTLFRVVEINFLLSLLKPKIDLNYFVFRQITKAALVLVVTSQKQMIFLKFFLVVKVYLLLPFYFHAGPNLQLVKLFCLSLLHLLTSVYLKGSVPWIRKSLKSKNRDENMDQEEWKLPANCPKIKVISLSHNL